MTRLTPTTPVATTLEHLLDAHPAVIRGFTRAADQVLERGHVSLAERDRLIERGVRLGLKRFDANLILAAVEQRRRESSGNLRLTHAHDQADSPALPRWLTWATVATIQASITIGAWWVLQ